MSYDISLPVQGGIVDSENGPVQYPVCLVIVVGTIGAEMKVVPFSESDAPILKSTSCASHETGCGHFSRITGRG